MPRHWTINGFMAQTPDFWMDKAQASSPELQAMRARLESARMDVQRAQSSHQPTVDAVLQINRSVSENVTSTRRASTNRQIGLQFDMPLYAGGAVQSAVRQALAEQTRLEETLEAARRDLNVRVQREWRGVTESVLRTSALLRAVASADQVVVSVKRSFEAGFRTVLDVLNAEQQAQQARRDLSEARITYVVSRMRLLALVGELDGQQIQQASRWFQP
jgi:outer membrane protein/protease secretion system outer membrane protein